MPPPNLRATGAKDAAVDALSGVAGSLVALGATYPLKTIYMVQALESQRGAATVLDILKRYKLGLYVGVGPSAFESATSSLAYFYLYSRLRAWAVQQQQKQLLQRRWEQPDSVNQMDSSSSSTTAGGSKSEDLGLLASLIVPAVAALGNQLLTMPASVIATRMQAAKKADMDVPGPGGRSGRVLPVSVGSVMLDIYRKDGLPGFWAGLLPSLVLISNPTIQYMLYEQLLAAVRAWRRRRQRAAAVTPGSDAGASGRQANDAGTGEAPDPAWATFTCSAAAKVGATLATYWLVVVKARMAAGHSTSGTLGTLRNIWVREGPGAFFKGLGPKLVQAALNAAIMLMIKEEVYRAARRVLDATRSDCGKRVMPGAAAVRHGVVAALT